MLIGVAVLSRMGLEETVGFAFDLFDYNGSHALTTDECTMLLRTLVGACAKMDSEKKLSEMGISACEALTERTWARVDKDEDGEITKSELLAFADNTPLATEFLKFIDGGASRVLLTKGDVLWTDPDFRPVGASLFLDPTRPPRGGLRPEQVGHPSRTRARCLMRVGCCCCCCCCCCRLARFPSCVAAGLRAGLWQLLTARSRVLLFLLSLLPGGVVPAT